MPGEQVSQPVGSPLMRRQVIRTYLLISGVYTLSASLIWGVNTLFLLQAGLNILEVFVANAAFTAGMVLFEIPTGVIADTRGRRTSVLLSAITLLVGTLGYLFASAVHGGLFLFVAASVGLGLGFSFYSGAVEAWLVDGLKAAGDQGELDSVFARGSMVSAAAMLLGTFGGGILGDVHLAWPYVVRAVLLAAVFAVALRGMHDFGFTPRVVPLSAMPAEVGAMMRAGLTHGWGRRSVRLIMIVALLQDGFNAWGFYAWQPYFLALLGRDAVWITGAVAALTALATITGNTVVDFLSRFCGQRSTLLVSAAIVFSAAAIGVGVAGSFWPAVACLVVANGAMGVAEPVTQAYLHQVIPSRQRATVVSFVSIFGSAGGIGGQLGLGYLSRVQSIGFGYVTGGIATVLALPILLSLRRLGEQADVIVGKAGRKAPCAAQGLPSVAGVDSTARQPLPGPGS
jgi:MFS family permease